MIFTPKIIFGFLVYNLNTGEANWGKKFISPYCQAAFAAKGQDARQESNQENPAIVRCIPNSLLNHRPNLHW